MNCELVAVRKQKNLFLTNSSQRL